MSTLIISKFNFTSFSLEILKTNPGNFKIFLDGENKGILKGNNEYQTEVAPGKHSLKLTSFLGNSKTYEFEINDREEMNLEVKNNPIKGGIRIFASACIGGLLSGGGKSLLDYFGVTNNFWTRLPIVVILALLAIAVILPGLALLYRNNTLVIEEEE